VARWRWSAGEPGNRIGRPVRNARLRILDAAGLPGEEGELLIGGPMVGLGYLGQPELTAERFFTCSETGLRFYRSGDRVRRVAPDLYDFLGRMDDQIKINGVRVEPEEVRCAIEAVPGVIQAAVAFERSAAGSAMTGYYRATPGTLDRATLMDRLSRRLPSAMIPARLVEVETMPVRASGKVDLERLRQARDTSPVTRSDTRSDVAQVLIGLWCEILNVPEARLSDNFFELGGDSLRLTRLIFAINKAYRVRLTPSAYRTLQDLGALIEHVERAVDSSAGTIPPDRRDGSKAEATTQGASGP
jgi:acyl carrier protein